MSPYFFIFYILDYVICVILSFAFTNYYVSKKVKKCVVIFSRLFLFVNYLLIFTLPYEIVLFKAKNNYLNELKEQNSTILNTTENITNTDIEIIGNILILNYKIIFWVLIGSSVQIINFIICYERSGEFTFKKRIFDAIKKTILILSLMPAIMYITNLILFVQNIILVIFLCFAVLLLAYVYVFLGLSIVKIPRIMYIHSDFKLAIEYYEFKASKKLNKLNNNNEELKKIYFKCKKTLEYIKNIEEFLIKKEKEKEKEKEEKKEKEKDESNENKISNNNLEEEINNINNQEKKEENDDETNQKKEEDDIKKIEKDFLKHKSFIKEKQYVELLDKNITEIINKNKIEIVDELDEKPIKKYGDLVNFNAKSKDLDSDNERINSQIEIIYKNWATLKEISMESQCQVGAIFNNDENNANLLLKADEFIPSMNISLKKKIFYKKYNKIIYISLMIFFIIIGILITLSEISLILPVNLSFLGLLFKYISNPILIHIFCILFSSFLFAYVSYSFGKIKSIGRQYVIFGRNQTNTLGLLFYCLKLSSISYPLCLNIIKMIFHKNVNEDIQTSLEEKYNDTIGGVIFQKIAMFIPIFLVVVIIFNIFDIKGKICKKRKVSFYTRNEKRQNYITEGNEFLMKMNKSNKSDKSDKIINNI